MYNPYASAEYYSSVYHGTTIPAEDLENMLVQASRHIDILTYNRIVSRGVEGLTAYQHDTVKDVCCRMADFEYDNADILQSVFKSYSINGVNMTFGDNWNLKVVNGIAVLQGVYEELKATGLCSQLLR